MANYGVNKHIQKFLREYESPEDLRYAPNKKYPKSTNENYKKSKGMTEKKVIWLLPVVTSVDSLKNKKHNWFS